MKRVIFLLLIIATTLASCADDKTFEVETPDGIEYIHAEPYGWADYESTKNPNVIYDVSVGNIVWDVLTIETIVVPIWLTGWQFYEPAALKPCAPNCS